MSRIVDTRIAGIHCLVRLEYHPFYPGTRDTPEEPEGYSVEEVMDRRGRRADWLAAKMTEKDEERIVGEAMEGLNEVNRMEAIVDWSVRPAKSIEGMI